ncbi:hypothetical protein [Neptuniibacter sp. QD37_11]|uniref:hypothetical protein n=1 Tax=Neptuniibacter sp. QD37_11 TaxID=3398209 RepID=UPI0039F63AD3
MATYKSGSRDAAIQNMVRCAIRDQQALIEAHSHLDDADSRRVIADAKGWIQDFKRLRETLVAK